MPANLTYSPKSGAIKRDGAVIGRVEQSPNGAFRAVLYLPDVPPIAPDPDLTRLLAAVRLALDPPPVAPVQSKKVSKKSKKTLAQTPKSA